MKPQSFTGRTIDRRTCVLIAALSLVHARARAQNATRLPRVGVLAPGHRATKESRGSAFDRFDRALRELGLIQGQTLQLEWRFDDYQPARMQQQVEELVSMPVDVIVAGTTGSALAAKRATTSIPIVMAVSADPVADGLVASLARPGGNVTGMSIMSMELIGKRLQLLAEAMPELSRVALFVDRTQVARAHAEMRHQLAAAARLNIQLMPIEVGGPEDFAAAFAEARRLRVQAVVLMQSAVFALQGARLAELALSNRLPTVSSAGDFSFAKVGGLMTYGPDIGSSWERAAGFVKRILGGARPADLPVEQPTRFELGINRQTASSLGLRIPASVLVQADELFP
jgi:putative tryptophan/tyrosine transport system substrate-binding protein